MRRRHIPPREIAGFLGWGLRTVYRWLQPDRWVCRHCGVTFPTVSAAWEHAIAETLR